jgi:hypothetical protein
MERGLFLYMRLAGHYLKVHKIENFFDDFGICVISLLAISKY